MVNLFNSLRNAVDNTTGTFLRDDGPSSAIQNLLSSYERIFVTFFTAAFNTCFSVDTYSQ